MSLGPKEQVALAALRKVRRAAKARGLKPKVAAHDAKIALYRLMTGGKSPTPLQELFGEIAVPLCGQGQPNLRVWYDVVSGWRASWGVHGAVGGKGATPEDAILQAHTNYITLRERNR